MLEWLKKIFEESPPMKKQEEAYGKTKVVIKYNAGFSNNLYIRGNGGGLTWERGLLLKNVGPDEWVWEPAFPIKDCEFKVLINDERYEVGENHHIVGGKHFQYTPRF